MSSLHNDKKQGRPVDKERAQHRHMMSEMSDRTFARYWEAMKLLGALDDREAMVTVIAQATRPNGSLNVAKLHRLASGAFLTQWLAANNDRGAA